MSAFRAALRLALRDALRARGRSLLVLVMIGLPVLVFTGLLTGQATMEVSPVEGLAVRLGAADARITVYSQKQAVRQDLEGASTSPAGALRPPRTWTAEQVAAQVGGRAIPVADGDAVYLTEGRYGKARRLDVDLRDPLTHGLRNVVSGRAPATEREIAVTKDVARIGAELALSGETAPRRVVGVVENPVTPGIAEVVSPPGTASSWLVGARAPIRWAEVKRLNALGLVVTSRSLIEDPPVRVEPPRSISGEVAVALTVIMLVMETVLLAGPAFAVGLRRRRLQLAMLAAQGASRGHLRLVVLTEALLLGGVAAVVGGVIGVGAGVSLPRVIAGQPWAIAELRQSVGPADVPWWPVLGVMALGLASAVIAALVPAVQAARQDPATVIAGRDPETWRSAGRLGTWRSAGRGSGMRAGRPVLGVVLVVAGLAGLAGGAKAAGSALRIGHGELIVAAALLVQFGLIAIMPWLIARSGRLAVRLPLALRLSVRDGVRHRVRTASAAAAVMAATSGLVAVLVSVSTQETAIQGRATTQMPHDTLVIRADSVDDATWARVREVAGKVLAGTPTTPVGVAVLPTGRTTWLGYRIPTWLGRRNPTCGLKCSSTAVSIGDGRVLELFLKGHPDPAAQQALAAGKAVVFGDVPVSGGVVELTYPGRQAPLRVPAVRAAGEAGLTGVLVPPEPVRAAGLEVKERMLLASTDRAEELSAPVEWVSGRARVYYDGSPKGASRQLWLLAGAAAVLVLGGTFAATGLALADLRRDLYTLSAVGARRGTRRLVAAAQAFHVAGLGALVGLLPGLATGLSLGTVWGTPAVPWGALLGVVAGLPVLAAALAWLVTRSRSAPVPRPV